MERLPYHAGLVVPDEESGGNDRKVIARKYYDGTSFAVLLFDHANI